MLIPEIIYAAAANKCPRCHRGKVFEHNNPYNFNHVFKMNDTCQVCGLKYEREAGFFYGAMYVSYALMAGILIIWFVADQLWLHTSAVTLFLAVVSTMLVFFPVAFRWARIIWINFFVRFDKRYAPENKKQAIRE